jgi:hypothetical protein
MECYDWPGLGYTLFPVARLKKIRRLSGKTKSSDYFLLGKLRECEQENFSKNLWLPPEKGVAMKRVPIY